MPHALTSQPKNKMAQRNVPSTAALSHHSPGTNVQRKCACGGTTGPSGECEGCRRKRPGTLLQRRADGTEPDELPPIVHEVLRSPGQPLDAAARAFMEPRFGYDFSRVPAQGGSLLCKLSIGAPDTAYEHEAERAASTVMHAQVERSQSLSPQDFSQVRVHTDARAAQSALAISALAYTVGRDIVFAEGQYAPGTGSGRRLLAHELTHVIQQRQECAQMPAIGSTDASGETTSTVSAAPLGLYRDVGWARRGPLPDPYGMGYNTILANAGAASEPAVRDLASLELANLGVDIAAFAALSNARALAVLALQDHSSGTACEPWFPLLVRSMIQRLIAASLFDDAIQLIVRAHHFPTTNLASITFDATVTGADAVTTGTIATGQPQTVRVGPSTFTASYEHMIRIIGHELQHVQQRTGATPITNQHVREFLAFAWEALGTGAPALAAADRVSHANIAIGHWNAAPVADRTPHQAVRDRLDRLIAAKGVGNF
jgi:hypothetical protein